MSAQRVGDLEVEQDLTFHRRFWTFQRIGWAVMALTIVAALLGLFGSGPLSNASSQSGDGALTVNYHRFGRFQSPSMIEVLLSPDAVQGNEAQIWIDSSYLNQVQVEDIMPEPDSMEAGSDRYVFTFAISSETAPAAITFHIRSEEPGPQSAQIGIVDGSSTHLRQLIFP